MANPSYTARAVLGFKAGLQTLPAGLAVTAGNLDRWLALLTTAPNDSDAGLVEVSASTYARLQIAGTLATSAAQGSAGTTLTFSSVPSWVVPGMTVLDLTHPSYIGAGITVSSVTGTTVVLSAATSTAVPAADVIAISAFPAATSEGPAGMATGPALSFVSSGASAWGTVVAGALYDAATNGNLLDWDWLGDDPWYPFSATDANPGVLTAIGITIGSSPELANGASVALTERFGGVLPGGLSAETPYTVAGLNNDAFNVGVQTTSTGSGLVRQLTQQAVPINSTFTVPSGGYSIYLA